MDYSDGNDEPNWTAGTCLPPMLGEATMPAGLCQNKLGRSRAPIYYRFV